LILKQRSAVHPSLSRRERTVRKLTFFFQAEDGIRDRNVTGVQTCALPISPRAEHLAVVLVRERDGPARRPGGSGAQFRHVGVDRSEEHTSELQSRFDLVCRLLLEKKKKNTLIRKTHTAPVSISTLHSMRAL